jgi:acyl-CoA hydrolase
MTSDLHPRSPKNSSVEMTEYVLPQHANGLGTIFGGTLVAWVDIAAAICSHRHARRSVVTASIDAMDFWHPVKVGWIVEIKANVNFVSRSSCEVGVKVMAENPLDGKRYHTASAFLTMVALDEHGQPTPMPPLELNNEIDRKRFAEGKARQEARLKRRKVLKNHD